MHTTDDLLREIETLRAEVRQLRAAVNSQASSAPSADPAAPTSNRRQLLMLAAAGIGGAGLAALAPAAPAVATNGDALVLGNAGGQTATLPTGVAVLGNAASYGLAFTDNGVNSIPIPSALLGHARGWGGSNNFSGGVVGFAEQDAFYGVYGDSVRCGVYGLARGPAANGWPGVLGEGQHGVGVRGDGGTYGVIGRGQSGGVRGDVDNPDIPALRASAASGLLALDGAQAAPPTSGSYRRGDIVNDKNGSGVWACVTAGNPGTWRKIAGAATAGAFHAIDGVRAYDSRSTGGRLSAGSTRTVTIPTLAAPTGATAITYLLTVLRTTGTGGLVVHRADRARPRIQSAAWFGPNQQHVVGQVTGLSPARQVKLYATAGSTHFILDVTGYYR